MDAFVSPYKPGDVVTNIELTNSFRVGNMGGMRRSKTTGTLVIISDHTKGIYEDKWFGDVLHYTGMGKIGDQVLEGNQNKTLAESDHNGVEVHLFEVLKMGEYIYRGIVHLCDSPYQEMQKDVDGNDRLVWMFPIKTEEHVIVDKDEFDSYTEEQEKKSKSLSFDDLKKRATEQSSSSSAYREVISNTYIRNPYIAEFAKKRANGVCQLCGQAAPFNDKTGNPYLESHHIIWLSRGGEDSIDNTVALCPNCHRKMHVVDSEFDKKTLQHQVQK